jgi:hypothetical protein
MVWLPEELRCRFCGGKAILMHEALELHWWYYYHYSKDYSKGCHQRINVFSDRMNTLTQTVYTREMWESNQNG